MGIYEYITQRLPEYGLTMSLDGYTPQQILMAARQTMRNRIETGPNEGFAVNIHSEVKIK